MDQLKPSEGTVTASFADHEIWHVLVASDDMKRMNVEQLDDAFRLDVVDASTLVWKTGMTAWRRLGSLAGLDDEYEQYETVTKQMTPETLAKLMPPPPPPPPRPRSLAPSPPRPAPVAAFKTQQFAAPLVASPMYVPQAAPQLFAPDPYVLPKRRVKVPSEVDFRRRSGGARVGRYLVGCLLLTVGVLACYRQNLLRDGARRLGIENKYLYSEQRAVAFVTAKTPGSVQNVLTRLKLLPGPNTLSATLSVPKPASFPVAPIAAAVAPPKAGAATTESDVKTVSLDSLPVLAADAATTTASETRPVAAAAAPRVATKPAAATKPVATKPVAATRKAAARQEREEAEEDERPAPKAKAEPKVAKAEAPEPKAKPVKAEPPPAGNESFLKAAIRSAIAQDAKK